MNLEGIRDIRGPVYFPGNYLLIVFLAALIVVAGGTFLVFFLMKKFKKKEETFIPPKLPHQVAYEALEALKAKNLARTGKIKEYYSELSDIVRRYIENRFDMRAPEMTTEEFLFNLKTSDNLGGTHKNLLKEFLNLADFVKFAKYGPTETETESSFAAAKRLVDETKAAEQNLEKVGVS